MADRRQGVTQLSDRAYETLKSAILSLQLRPSEPLVERDLANELSMSVTPVREALQRLERDGLVTRIPFRGACVSMIGPADVEEIFELRGLLEGRCARISATQLTEKDLQELRDLLMDAEKHLANGDHGVCGEAIWLTHDVLMRGVRNGRLIELLKNIRAQARRVGAITAYIPNRAAKSIKEHKALLDALEKKDPDLAEQTMIDHMQSLCHDIISDYERGGVSTTFLVSENRVAELYETAYR